MKLRTLAAIAAFAWTLPAAAQHNRAEIKGADTLDLALLRIDEGRHLGQPVADVEVRTEAGVARFGALTAGQPTVLLLGYYACRGVCPTTIRNLAQALRGVHAPEHRVVVLSFDPNDTLDDLDAVKSDLGVLPASWTFGLLARDAALRLTQSVGYRFFFSERDQVYVHPSVLVFLSPDGRVMRYLYGVDPRPQDLKLALIEAGQRTHRLNDLVNMAKLVCYRYDPARSRYVLHPAVIFGALGLGVLLVTGVAAFTFRRSIQGAQS